MGGIWGAPRTAWDHVHSWSDLEKIGLAWSATWAAGTMNEIAYSSLGAARYGTYAIAATQAVAAVTVPIAMGYVVSGAISGDKGRREYLHFLSGGVSPQEYWNAITLKSMR